MNRQAKLLLIFEAETITSAFLLQTFYSVMNVPRTEAVAKAISIHKIVTGQAVKLHVQIS